MQSISRLITNAFAVTSVATSRFSFAPARKLLGAFALVAITMTGTGCAADDDGVPSDPAKETFAASLAVDVAQMTMKTNGLYVKDLVVGNGSEAIAGRSLKVFYSGYLTNATLFDSNVGKTVFTFTLGIGSVIKGWDLGLQGMRVGGKRKIVIASALGYGASGSGSIPPNATLVFDVELTAAQ